MRKRLWRRPSPAMVVAIIAVILAVAGTATAALTKKDKKKVKNIATNVATQVFDQKSPSLKDGCPGGTVRAGGECFETAARAGTDYLTAADICSAAGRRLPSSGELLAARSAVALVGSGVTTAEMSSDFFRDGSSFGFIGVTDDGSLWSVEGILTSLSHQYRCVGPLTNA